MLGFLTAISATNSLCVFLLANRYTSTMSFPTNIMLKHLWPHVITTASDRLYKAVMYPGVLAVSMRKYVYAVLLLAHVVPFPPTSDVEHE